VVSDQGTARHLIIGIYGVGSASPEEIRSDLEYMLEKSIPQTATCAVEVFDWDTCTPHRSRDSQLWNSGSWFSSAFVRAAYYDGFSRSPLITWCAVALQLMLGILLIPILTAAAGSIALAVIGSLQSISESYRHSAPYYPLHSIYFNLAQLALHSIPLVVRSAVIAASILACLTIALGGVEALVTRKTETLWSCIRTLAFLIALAPSIVLSVLLFAKPDDDSSPKSLSAFLSVLFGSLGLVLAIVLNLSVGQVHIFYRLVLAGFGFYLGLLLIAGISSRAARRLTKTWLVGAKVLLDIGLYVGSSTRQKIQSEFGCFIGCRARDATNVWIVAHSLGSVIALDSLLNRPEWTKQHDVVLITCGSPIRRLFVRFFPGLFFPCDLSAASGMVAQRVKQFRWINIYRTFDYIGKRLGLGYNCEMEVNRLWPWHTQYWSDTKAFDAVRTLLAKCIPIVPAQSFVLYHPDNNSSLPSSLHTLGNLLNRLRVPISILVALSTVWLIRARTAPAQVPIQLASSMARVSDDRYFDPRLRVRHRLQFQFRTTPESAPITTTIDTSVFDLAPDDYFDSDKLIHKIRANCKGARPSVCAVDGVRIEFDPNNPTLHFRLPDFPAHPSPWKTVALLVIIGVLMGFLTYFSIRPALLITSPSD